MSHALPAAGGGFGWPALTLESDGESIEMSMHPSGNAGYEPLKYLGRFRAWVKAGDFELSVSQFVTKVLARLYDRGILNTQLHDLWSELSSERADENSAQFRRIEAILGFDPGEADDEAVQRIGGMRSNVGSAAAEEIAYASAGSPNIIRTAESIVNSVGPSSPAGRFELRPEELAGRFLTAQAQPWHRGYALADELRSHCGLGQSVVSDDSLSKLLGIAPSALKTQREGLSQLPFGLAVRSLDASGTARFVFRSSVDVRRRFEAARMLADHFLAPASDAWLPATATRTARQKSQRAFAAEFLCPNRELRNFIRGDSSDYRIEDAATHFGVAVETVRHQVANHWQ